MKLINIMNLLISASLLLLSAACDEPDVVKPTVSEWSGQNINSIKAGNCLYYAVSMKAKDVYDFPLLRSKVATVGADSTDVLPGMVRIPVPDKDFTLEISPIATRYFNSSVPGNLDLVCYWTKETGDYTIVAESTDWYDLERRDGKIFLHFKKLGVRSPRKLVLNYNCPTPAPFISDTANGELYSLPEGFWFTPVGAGVFAVMEIRLIRITDSEIPGGTIEKYGCSLFPPYNYGYDSDEPDPEL